MLSLRIAARSTRAMPRLATGSSLLRGAMPVVARTSAITSQAPTLSSTVSYLPRLTSSFSTGSALLAKQEKQTATGEADAELSAKLTAETQFEEEMAKEEETSSTIQEFLDNGPFKVVDTPGLQEVLLERTFGDEKITIAFSVAEVPYEELPEDEMAYDDLERQQPGGDRNQRGLGANEEESQDEEEEHAGEPSQAVHFTVTIQKPGKVSSVLSIDCTAQDGEAIIDYLNYYPTAEEALAKTPQASHQRSERYAGPTFAELDEDLQVSVENYLEERGVTAGLAVFLPEYVKHKEQREYLRWLNNVKGFVDA